MQKHLPISYLCEYIRDLAFGTPRQRYQEFVKDLKDSFHPTCDPVKCKWSGWCVSYGSIMMPPNLSYTALKKCKRCEKMDVSDRYHSVCHSCAQVYDTVEFKYHHDDCFKRYDYRHFSFTREPEE